MVKRIGLILCSLILMFALSSTGVLAETGDVPLSADNTTVQNALPEIMVYCETSENYAESAAVEADGYPAEVISAQAFSKRNEGIDYFVLVDVSTSIKEDTFSRVQRSLIGFAQSEMSELDHIYLIPFGEKVYYDHNTGNYDPKSDDFARAVKALKPEDHYTNLYDAIDTVASIAAADRSDSIVRKAVLVVTDGMDDTTGGYKNEQEAPKALKRLGIPLYAFAVGKVKKDARDKLGVLSRSLNGRLYTGNLSSDLTALKNTLDNTLTIEAKANNAADLGSAFDVSVSIDGQEQDIVKKGITANKTGELKNSTGYNVKKFFKAYWWIVALIALAVIATIVLAVIRRHKGIIKVDGETVFRDNVTQKQRIKVNKKNVIKMKMRLTVDGSSEVVRDLDFVNSMIVGRSNACDLSVEDPTMGRQHFCIEMRDGKLFLQDLGSTNGTILNGIKITEPQILHQGDVIVAGRSRMIIDW